MKKVQKVNNKEELKSFIDFPHELYKDCPFYVPELFIAQRDLLTKHPFLKHSEIQLFLAVENGRVIGRIAAILNNNHNKINHSNDGFFGFFDVIDDLETAGLLFTAAEDWLKFKKVNNIIGPVNPSTNETCALLVDGFDSPPRAMMTYNFPYYVSLIEQLGFVKQTDLLAYDVFDDENFDDKPFRVLKAFNERLKQKGITIRQVNLKNFDQEVSGLMKVYNEAWDKNMGFVPMTNEEFRYMAKDLKLILDKDFCLVAEHEGNLIAFALCIPDVNQILIKIKKGRLLPTGIFKLLLGKKKINALRVIALGVTEPYRKLGIEAVFYGMIIQKGREKGIKQAEASWILEDNVMMNRAMQHINAKPYKRYRLYEKEIIS